MRVTGPPATPRPGPLLPRFWLGFATRMLSATLGPRGRLLGVQMGGPCLECLTWKTRWRWGRAEHLDHRVCPARWDTAGVIPNVTLPSSSCVPRWQRFKSRAVNPKAHSEGTWDSAGQERLGPVPNQGVSDALPLRGGGIVCGRACMRVRARVHARDVCVLSSLPSKPRFSHVQPEGEQSPPYSVMPGETPQRG